MTRKTFRVNQTVVVVREYPTLNGNSRYTCEIPGTYRQAGYTTSRGCPEAVLLSFLDDAGRAKAIDHRTANWPEGKVETLHTRKGTPTWLTSS